MAKKSKNINLLGLLAFAALIIKTVAFILSYFGVGLGVFTFLADVVVTGTVLLVAWNFARTCGKNWRTVYLVILILVIVGFVFGGLSI